MILSKAYKQDVLSKNITLLPIVIIEDVEVLPPQTGGSPDPLMYIKQIYGFSTHNIELNISGDPLYCKPLLMDMPKLKESIDVETGLYKISSLILNFSNAEYNGKRMSDMFETNMFINKNISIHIKTQTCTSVKPYFLDLYEGYLDDIDLSTDKDCLRIYVGKIRRVSHTNDKVVINVEDLTEQKIHRDLPSEKLPDSGSIPDKYRNKYIPMLYGKLFNAPVVAKWASGDLEFMTDYREIYSIAEEEYASELASGGAIPEEDVIRYGGLRFKDGELVKATPFIWRKFVTDEDDDDYANIDVGTLQYQITNSGTILLKAGLLNVDRIQGIYDGSPTDVIFKRQFDGYLFDDPQGSSIIHTDILGVDDIETTLSDNDYTTVAASAYEGPIYDDADWTQDGHTNFPAFLIAEGNGHLFAHNPYRLSFIATPSSAKYSKVLKVQINQFNLPVQGDEELIGGKWGENDDDIWLTHFPEAFEEVNTIFYGDQAYQIDPYGPNYDYDTIQGRVHRPSTYQDIFNNMSFAYSLGGPTFSILPSATDYYCNTLLDLNRAQDWTQSAEWKFVISHNADWLAIYQSQDNAFMGDPIPMLRFAMGKNSSPLGQGNDVPNNHYCIEWILNFLYDNSDWADQWDGDDDTNPFGDIVLNNTDMNFSYKLKEIDTFSLVEFDDAIEKDFFANARGRVNSDLFNYDHIVSQSYEYLTNPIDIMRDILTNELGITKFNEEEFKNAWFWHNGWEFAFSVTEKINSKKLLQELSQSTMTFPRLKNNGEFGFVTIKSMYSDTDYNDAITIIEDEVIKYSYKLTSPEKVISKFNIDYGYDYESGDFKKTIMGHEDFTGGQGQLMFTDMELDIDPNGNFPIMDFNGIENSIDNEVTFESKFIQDDRTARNLKLFKYVNNKLQHLIIDLVLPLQYNNIEVGTLIKFPKDKLLNNMKAYGIDYTNPVAHGGNLRFPLFLVTSVQRSLNNISISCYQLHWLWDPIYNSDDPYHYQKQNTWWNETSFPNVNWNDPALTEQEEGEPFNPYGPELPTTNMVLFDCFNIGFESTFSQSELEFPSDWLRKFTITDVNIGTGITVTYPSGEEAFFPNYFYLKDRFESIFGLSRFDNISNWNDLVQDIDSDGNYGSITSGADTNQIGGFIAMEIRFTNQDEQKLYALSLRNIAGTEFDPDIYDPETTIIPVSITPSTTELKLGWVLYVVDSDEWSDWSYLHIANYNATISENLQLPMHSWFPNQQDNYARLFSFRFDMALYPYYNPINTQMLTYCIDWVSLVWFSELASNKGDMNLDGEITSADANIMAQYINDVANGIEPTNYDGTPFTEQQIINGDINDDGVIDELDLNLLIDMMVG